MRKKNTGNMPHGRRECGSRTQPPSTKKESAVKVKEIAKCELVAVERRALRKAQAIIDQLAWHYRETDFGDRSKEAEGFL